MAGQKNLASFPSDISEQVFKRKPIERQLKKIILLTSITPSSMKKLIYLKSFIDEKYF